MTSHIDRRPSHSMGANEARGRRVFSGSTRQARTRRVYDGVVASYIREISAPPKVHVATERPQAGR